MTSARYAEPVAGLSSAEVCDLAGITYRQLDHWVRMGVIEPAEIVTARGAPCRRDRLGPGSGHHRRFTARQAAILRACGVLARLCADTAALQALALACESIELPATVAIDVDGRAHLGTVPAVGC